VGVGAIRDHKKTRTGYHPRKNYKLWVRGERGRRQHKVQTGIKMGQIKRRSHPGGEVLRQGKRRKEAVGLKKITAAHTRELKNSQANVTKEEKEAPRM